MFGLAREDALTALKQGWRRDCLVLLNQQLKDIEMKVTGLEPWGIVVQHTYLIYKSFTPSEIAAAFDAVQAGECTAFCDGSGNTSDKVAGIGCVIYRPEESPLLFAENIGLGSNNRAELCAAWRALRAMPDTTQKILIRTDSEYTIGALTKDWARNANAELITNMRRDLEYRRDNVRFEHVDGHSGVEGNETADRLANIGRKLVTKISVYEG